MSEKSRLETCEKNIVALIRSVRDLTEKVSNLYEEHQEVAEELDGAHEHLTDVEEKIDALNGLLLKFPGVNAAGAPSETE